MALAVTFRGLHGFLFLSFGATSLPCRLHRSISLAFGRCRRAIFFRLRSLEANLQYSTLEFRFGLFAFTQYYRGILWEWNINLIIRTPTFCI